MSIDGEQEQKRRGVGALIVEEQSEASACLPKFFLSRSLPVEHTSIAKSLHRAITMLAEDNFEHCFLDAQFPVEALSDFFRDFSTIERKSNCLFFLFAKDGPPPLPAPLKENILGCISLKGSEQDYKVMLEAEAYFQNQADQTLRQKNVLYATGKLLDVIDQAASDVARNAHRGMRTALKDVLHQEADCPAALDRYISALTEQTNEREVHDTSLVEIPDSILQKDLPKLTKTAYQGRSQRVWLKMQKKFKATEPLKDGQSTEVTTQEGDKTEPDSNG